MSNAAEDANSVDKALPTAVDVKPRKGRRVRTPDGSLLPEGHILRGEPRSPYWLRLERDGDVRLTTHVPETEVPAPEPESKPSASTADPVALPPIPLAGGGKKS